MKSRLAEFTLCVPFYRQAGILELQIKEWNKYPPAIKVILVDDCSPEPAEPVVRKFASEELLSRLELLRVAVDKPWNRAMCRNLSAQRAQSNWIMHVDTDHIFPAQHAQALLEFEANEDRWYRFRRFRVGRADDTRRKDKIDPNCEFGEIKPHIDSYLCTRELYWRVGGYDEDFSGMLGGGSPFLAQLTEAAQMEMAPSDISLHVYTRSVAPDASVSTLSRDTSRYAALRKEKERTGNTKAKNPVRLKWSRVF